MEPRCLLVLLAAACAALVASSSVAISATALAARPRKAQCDYSVGSWVPYPSKFPRYSGIEGAANYCKYIRTLWNCDLNKRPDKKYQQFRWQPKGCNLEYFKPSGFKYIMRRKRLLMVGDSIMANVFEALTCLMAAGGFQMKPQVKRFGTRSPFRGYAFPEFNFEMHYHFSAYLAQNYPTSNTNGKPGGHGNTVDIDEVDIDIKNALPYYDVVVFSSGTWWSQNVPGRIQRNKYRVNKKEVQLTDLQAYNYGLRTLRKHLVDTQFKGIPYFFTISPKHYGLPLSRGAGACGFQGPTRITYPGLLNAIITSSYYSSVQEEVLSNSLVRLVKITQMSNTRPDGHMGLWSEWSRSVNGVGSNWPGDCTHWCLPGVPDSWVDMLYSQMLLEPSLLSVT